MAYFVVRTQYLAGQEEARLAARPGHRQWLAALRDQGSLLNAGPLADGSGALLLFVAADRPALEELLAGDPYPGSCVQVSWVGEWQPLFDAR